MQITEKLCDSIIIGNNEVIYYEDHLVNKMSNVFTLVLELTAMYSIFNWQKGIRIYSLV